MKCIASGGRAALLFVALAALAVLWEGLGWADVAGSERARAVSPVSQYETGRAELARLIKHGWIGA